MKWKNGISNRFILHVVKSHRQFYCKNNFIHLNPTTLYRPFIAFLTLIEVKGVKLGNKSESKLKNQQKICKENSFCIAPFYDAIIIDNIRK